MKAIKLYIGLDVHKDSITIAIAPAVRVSEIRLFGTISNDLHALEKALARIRQAHPGSPLEVAYEAGPCGFGIARCLKQLDVPSPKAKVAVARELGGFVWALLRTQDCYRQPADGAAS